MNKCQFTKVASSKQLKKNNQLGFAEKFMCRYI